jgi:hypothetical protein
MEELRMTYSLYVAAACRRDGGSVPPRISAARSRANNRKSASARCAQSQSVSIRYLKPSRMPAQHHRAPLGNPRAYQARVHRCCRSLAFRRRNQRGCIKPLRHFKWLTICGRESRSRSVIARRRLDAAAITGLA